MDLTVRQAHVVRDLIGTGSGPDEALGRDLAAWAAGRLEDLLAAAGVEPGSRQIRLWKSLVTSAERCPGLFDAHRKGEGPPFEHTRPTAAGTLAHKTIELDVLTERRSQAADVAPRAVERLMESAGPFERYWRARSEAERVEMIAQASARLTLFRSSFPPLSRRWTPHPEFPVRAVAAGGRVVLTGRADLVLGRRNRLAIDLKSGDARPEHAEDMRFYALLLALRLGVAPYRVATVFLDSGEWQAEDVTRDVLERACDRVAMAEALAARLDATPAIGQAELRPGYYCGRCPRRAACPAAAAAFDRPSARDTVSDVAGA